MPKVQVSNAHMLKTYEREYVYIIRDIVQYQTGCIVLADVEKDRSLSFSIERDLPSGRTIKYAIKLQPIEKFDRIEAMTVAFAMVDEICKILKMNPHQFLSDEV